jgi:hypothetical protein
MELWHPYPGFHLQERSLVSGVATSEVRAVPSSPRCIMLSTLGAELGAVRPGQRAVFRDRPVYLAWNSSKSLALSLVSLKRHSLRVYCLGRDLRFLISGMTRAQASRAVLEVEGRRVRLWMEAGSIRCKAQRPFSPPLQLWRLKIEKNPVCVLNGRHI